MSSQIAALRAKTGWVFDLDNTLYPAECDLFSQIDIRMATFVSRALGVDHAEARVLQKRYLVEHGTTLNGLMARHGLEPGPYLDFVHDIDLSPVAPAPDLARAIASLPGAKIVFTNGSRGHAERVTEKLGLGGLFDHVFSIEDATYIPKPRPEAFARLIARCGVDPVESVMFEDITRNLEPAAALGFATVLVRSDKDWSHEPAEARPAGAGETPDFVDFATDDLTAFLAEIVAPLARDPRAGADRGDQTAR
jgi:putative hydrolase of the HAD superfamily